MEFRVLKYFLAVARTGKYLPRRRNHACVPTGIVPAAHGFRRRARREALIRGNRNTTLTEAGFLLKKRAEEIAQLVDKTVDELSHAQEGVSGSVRIGCGRERPA